MNWAEPLAQVQQVRLTLFIVFKLSLTSFRLFTASGGKCRGWGYRVECVGGGPGGTLESSVERVHGFPEEQ
jgi:hypothetical protein